MFRQGYKYSTLKGSVPGATQNYRRLHIFAAALLITFLSSSLTVFTIWQSSPEFLSCRPRISHSSDVVAQRPQLSCGRSLEEARKRGCTFDPLSVSWLHPDCSRHGVTEFIAAAGNDTKWRYWLDKEGDEEILDYEALSVLRRDQVYWTTQREHMNHCVWMLLRVHEAMENGSRVDGLAQKYGHTKHCLMMMLKMASNENDEKITTGGDVGYSVC